jgi:predicted TPR repeat methyltransferase
VTSNPFPEYDMPMSEVYLHRRIDAIAARWDAKAESWERDLIDPCCHLNEDGAYGRFMDQLGSILRARQSFCADKGVIDAGCATGLVMAQAVSWFAWGVGVDISPKMIRAANAKQISNAKFVVGDCFKLSDICPKAAAVLSRGVLLSHYGEKQAIELLSSGLDCLVDGGFILWDFLNADGRYSYQHTPENKAYFSAAEVDSMAKGAGFKTVKVLGEPQRRVQLLLAER